MNSFPILFTFYDPINTIAVVPYCMMTIIAALIKEQYNSYQNLYQLTILFVIINITNNSLSQHFLQIHQCNYWNYIKQHIYISNNYNLSTNMQKIILITLFIAVTLTWTIQKYKQNQGIIFPSVSALTFENYTCPGTSKSLTQRFIKATNDASTIWGSDIAKNLNYITNYMNMYEAEAPDEYFVFIQTKATSSGFSSSTVYNICASISNINSKYSTWSYLFIKIARNKQEMQYETIQLEGTGKGISQQLKEFINSVVKQYDTESICNCGSFSSILISDRLKQNDGQQWDLVCDDNKDLHALIDPKNSQWMYTKGSGCYYFVYVYI